MKLEGSCHCGGVRFSVESRHPYPFMRCYCGVCRKTQGGGGYAINLAAEARSLEVRGKENLRVYRARIRNPEDRRSRQSSGRRHFCGRCGSALWLFDPTWPELVHPFASAIDTPLPTAPEHVHLMLEFKPDWVPLHAGAHDRKFKRYPKESIARWHQRHGLEQAPEAGPSRKGPPSRPSRTRRRR